MYKTRKEHEKHEKREGTCGFFLAFFIIFPRSPLHIANDMNLLPGCIVYAASCSKGVVCVKIYGARTWRITAVSRRTSRPVRELHDDEERFGLALCVFDVEIVLHNTTSGVNTTHMSSRNNAPCSR